VYTCPPDERFGDPPPKVDPGAFSGQTRMEDPKRTFFCVCSESSLFGVSTSRERDLLSVLLIYHRIFFCIFIVYCRIVFCYMLLDVGSWLLWFSCRTCPPFSVWPHLFCGAGHEKQRGEQLKWPLTFRLYTGSFPCAQLPGPIHTARLGRMCFSILSLGLCFACSFVLFELFVCPHSFVFPWAVESSPYSSWR